MAFATTHDRRNVSIKRENFTSGVPAETTQRRRYHSDKSQGKRMTIDFIQVEWQRQGVEAWFPKELKIAGTLFKADGTLGQLAGEREYLGDRWQDYFEPEAWLLAEIALYTPSGDAW